jgi:hypothetical protein
MGEEMTDEKTIDWGYSVNRLMEAARRSVANVADVRKLIEAKLDAADAGHKINGVEGIRIVQDNRREARALIAAEIEKQLPEITDEDLSWIILETALKSEDLRRTRASDDPFRHQLKLETMCEELTGAVLFLLCRQLPQPAKVSTDDEGTSDASGRQAEERIAKQ